MDLLFYIKKKTTKKEDNFQDNLPRVEIKN